MYQENQPGIVLLTFIKEFIESNSKKKAPRAIREIKKFAEKTMSTNDVRIDTNLNKFIWSNGIRNLPFRVRVRLDRKKNEDDNAKG